MVVQAAGGGIVGMLSILIGVGLMSDSPPLSTSTNSKVDTSAPLIHFPQSFSQWRQSAAAGVEWVTDGAVKASSMLPSWADAQRFGSTSWIPATIGATSMARILPAWASTTRSTTRLDVFLSQLTNRTEEVLDATIAHLQNAPRSVFKTAASTFFSQLPPTDPIASSDCACKLDSYHSDERAQYEKTIEEQQFSFSAGRHAMPVAMLVWTMVSAAVAFNRRLRPGEPVMHQNEEQNLPARVQELLAEVEGERERWRSRYNEALIQQHERTNVDNLREHNLRELQARMEERLVAVEAERVRWQSRYDEALDQQLELLAERAHNDNLLELQASMEERLASVEAEREHWQSRHTEAQQQSNSLQEQLEVLQQVLPFRRIANAAGRRGVWLRESHMSQYEDPLHGYDWSLLQQGITGEVEERDAEQINNDIHRLYAPDEYFTVAEGNRERLREVLCLYARRYPISQGIGYAQHLGNIAAYLVPTLPDQGELYVMVRALTERFSSHFFNDLATAIEEWTPFLEILRRRVAPFFWEKCERNEVEPVFGMMLEEAFLSFCTTSNDVVMLSDETRLMILDAIICGGMEHQALKAAVAVLYFQADQYFRRQPELDEVVGVLESFKRDALEDFGRATDEYFCLMNCIHVAVLTGNGAP